MGGVGPSVWKSHLNEQERRWLSEENFWELVWLGMLEKTSERSIGFEITFSWDLWPLWTRFKRNGINLGFDISLFLVHSLITPTDVYSFSIQSLTTQHQILYFISRVFVSLLPSHNLFSLSHCLFVSMPRKWRTMFLISDSLYRELC